MTQGHCPISSADLGTTRDGIVGNELITVTVTVPFTTITPLVHLKRISASVSGLTFPY